MGDYDISVWIVMFLVFFNAGAGALVASGAAGYIGIQPEVCGGDRLDNAASNTQDVDTGTGGGATLFGFYNALADPLESVFNAIFPGAAMLKCVGIPKYVVNFAFAGIAMVPGLDLLYYLRNR